MTLNSSGLHLGGKNIVIVDDDIPSIRYYEMLLRNSGASVQIFHTGKEFVDYIAEEPHPKVDLVFMDFLIPLVNGIDCIRTFRKQERNVPVVMITAYSSEQTRTEAFIAGCSEYVLKPIYPEKILFIVDKYLAQTSIPYPFLN